jgi:hypothetical protein
VTKLQSGASVSCGHISFLVYFPFNRFIVKEESTGASYFTTFQTNYKQYIPACYLSDFDHKICLKEKFTSEAHAKMGLRTYQRSAADMPLPSVHSDIKES